MTSAAKQHQVTLPLRELNRALTEELALGRQLLDIANEQGEAIKATNVERLRELEELANAVLQSQAQAEERRVRASREVAEALGLASDAGLPEAPLSDILQRLPVSEARRLIEQRGAILAVAQAIHAANARNRPLLENALDFARFSLEALTAAVARAPRYGVNPNAGYTPTLYLDHEA